MQHILEGEPPSEQDVCKKCCVAKAERNLVTHHRSHNLFTRLQARQAKQAIRSFVSKAKRQLLKTVSILPSIRLLNEMATEC